MNDGYMADFSVPSAAALSLWLTQYVEPLVQAIILILTAAFIALGVMIRWRHLRQMHGSHSDLIGPFRANGDRVLHE